MKQTFELRPEFIFHTRHLNSGVYYLGDTQNTTLVPVCLSLKHILIKYISIISNKYSFCWSKLEKSYCESNLYVAVKISNYITYKQRKATYRNMLETENYLGNFK